jgi:polyphosphate kinase
MRALMSAVERGKQVSVFVEIKARFDEAANLEWGERLEKAGVRVHYSFPGVKVHAKLGLVRRVEAGVARLYAYLATGNFNEQTAPIYGDMGIFTAHTELCEEVSAVFTFLENVKPPRQAFKHLLVGKFNLRSDLEALIDREIAAAKKKKPASMVLKMNSLEDPQMMNRLYKASKAGVKIKLIVRGICCIVPGVPGLSDNIDIISIVDRFLEHARIFVFHNGGDPLYYLSSADFMERNLSYRIETCFPVLDPNLKAEIQYIVDLQLADNVKARIIDRFDQNLYKRTSSDVPVRAQIDSYYYYKRHQDKS